MTLVSSCTVPAETPYDHVSYQKSEAVIYLLPSANSGSGIIAPDSGVESGSNLNPCDSVIPIPAVLELLDELLVLDELELELSELLLLELELSELLELNELELSELLELDRLLELLELLEDELMLAE